MITVFDTATAPATGKKGSNTLLVVLVLGVLAYLGWRYVIKPEMDKKKAAETAK